MRRRPFWLRAFAALLAVWFPLVLGEPSLLQPCPTHGAAAAHAGHGAPATTHGHNQAPTNKHHDCTCIGCCTAGSAAAVAPAATEFVVAISLTGEPDIAPAAAAARPTPPEFARPYTTGPPRA